MLSIWQCTTTYAWTVHTQRHYCAVEKFPVPLSPNWTTAYYVESIEGVGHDKRSHLDEWRCCIRRRFWRDGIHAWATAQSGFYSRPFCCCCRPTFRCMGGGIWPGNSGYNGLIRQAKHPHPLFALAKSSYKDHTLHLPSNIGKTRMDPSTQKSVLERTARNQSKFSRCVRKWNIIRYKTSLDFLFTTRTQRPYCTTTS